VRCQGLKLGFTVIPAQAGIQIAALVSRLRGNDVTQKLRFDKALVSSYPPGCNCNSTNKFSDGGTLHDKRSLAHEKGADCLCPLISSTSQQKTLRLSWTDISPVSLQ
jgi:hypothetical protein